MPLHVWLPLAHPAAPSHVSALMSGVMTKVAVYGFIRIVFDLNGPPAWWWSLPVLALGAATAAMWEPHTPSMSWDYVEWLRGLPAGEIPKRLQPLVDDVLSERSVSARGIFSPAAVRRLMVERGDRIALVVELGESLPPVEGDPEQLKQQLREAGIAAQIGKELLKVIDPGSMRLEGIRRLASGGTMLTAAILSAVASSVRNRPIQEHTAVFGEVGLAGELRIFVELVAGNGDTATARGRS